MSRTHSILVAAGLVVAVAACTDAPTSPTPSGTASPDRASITTPTSGIWTKTVEGQAGRVLDVTMTVLSMRQAMARGISANGRVVGNLMGMPEFGFPGPHAFVWEDGVLSELPTAGGGPLSNAFGVSPRGDIVGWADPVVAVVWVDGVPRALPSPDGCSSVAVAISADGDIVGSCDGRPLLWHHDAMRDLGLLPGGTWGYAAAINARGQIVGTSVTASGDDRAVLWDKGVITDLGTLGGTSSSAYAINARGQVVGWSTTRDGDTHAFLWQAGVMTDLGALDGGTSIATGINARGQVVGWSRGPTVAERTPLTQAVLWENGVLVNLNTPPALASDASAINDRGQIAGTAGFGSPFSGTHPVLWTVK